MLNTEGRIWAVVVRAESFCEEEGPEASEATEAAEAAARPPVLMGGGAEGGTPAEEPPVWMLAALRTWAAARLRLPEERMPASPASMAPSGATRVMLLGGSPGTVARAPMPPPVARPERSVSTAALCGSMSTRVGGAERTVLAAEPAAMSPPLDQMEMSPPRRVKIREVPTSTEPSVKI